MGNGKLDLGSNTEKKVAACMTECDIYVHAACVSCVSHFECHCDTRYLSKCETQHVHVICCTKRNAYAKHNDNVNAIRLT